MPLVATLKVLRVLGVPAGIFLLLPGEHPPDDRVGYLLLVVHFAIGVFTCIPFSRLRSAAFFWPVFSAYAVLVAMFAGLCGWRFVALFPARGVQNSDMLILLLMLLAMFLLLFAQIPCIFILRRQNNAA